MNFACPTCSLAGQITDERLPEQGLYATCPKCKARFLVKREIVATSPPIVTEAPVVESITKSEAIAPENAKSPPSPPQEVKPVKLPETRETSTAVKVIGCLFIAVAGFKILVAVFGYLALSSVTKMASGLTQTTAGAADASRAFQYLVLWIAAQILIGAFVIVAAVQFMRLRAWARTALEVVSWLGLAYVIGTGIMSVAAWGKISGMASKAGFGSAPSAFGTMGLILSVGTMVVFAVPLIVVIWHLRGETISKVVR